MRTSKRIGSVVLAGTLLFTLGFGQLAFAETTTAAPAEPTGATEVASSVLSLKTASAYGVTFQVSEAWQTMEDPDSMSVAYMTEDFQSFVQVQVSDADESAELDELAANPEAFFDSDEEDIEVGTVRRYELDGAQAIYVNFAGTDGTQREVGGYILALCTPEKSAVVTAVWGADVAEDEIWALEQTGRSLMFADEEEVFMLDGPGMVGSDPSASDTAEPATEPTPEPAKPEPATPADGASVTFEVPGWEITASTDPATFVYATVESYDDSVNGKEVIGVPVTLKNLKSESASPFWTLNITLYGPRGVAQGGGSMSSAGWYFDDSIENAANMRAGATNELYVYFYDEGEGEYVAEISAWDENYNTIKEEVSVMVTK